MKKQALRKIVLLVLTRITQFLAFVVVFGLTIAAPVRADQGLSSGEFTDSAGAPHPWHINSHHTLFWGGRPWIPAGGIFQSRYLSGPQTAENWSADVADLLRLKKHGIHSLILVTSAELDPITDLPSDSLQKVLDYLDSQGFQYGLSLSSFPRDPVSATIVNPAIYRVASPDPGSVNYFRNLSGLTGAVYYLVSSADGSIIASGNATVVDAQTASVRLDSTQGGAGTVLLLFPTRIFLPDSIEGKHLPDIWTQADGYRDSLLLYFNKIHFGAGLRFFLDPIVNGLGYYGDADAGAVPDSTAYRFQFQIWLQTRYSKSLPSLNSSWGVKNQDVFDFAAASRCVPLWYQSKGIQFLIDPVSGKSFETVAASSHYWEDVRDFRIDSMRMVMDEMASALKNGVADVPVVYRWTRPSKIYVDDGQGSGYDGLLISSPEHGGLLARNAAGWALAEAEQSERSFWLIGELTPAAAQPSSGYGSETALEADNKVLSSLAVKGYFIDSFRRIGGGNLNNASLLDAPEQQLDWISSDAVAFSDQSSVIADYVPNILYFPINLELPTTSVQQFDDGTWWLPSYRLGTTIDVGRGLACYQLDQPAVGSSIVLWSPDGSVSTAQFELPKKTNVSATTPAGQIVTINLNKGVYSFATSKIPLLIHGVDTLPLVANATLLEIAEAQELIDAGTTQQIPMDVDEQRLYYIKNEVLAPNDAAHQHIAYPLLVSLNNEMESELDPNAWVEGEDASEQTFGAVVASPSAAGGAFLWQDTTSQPASSGSPYEATYTLNVSAPGNYTVWASIAPGAPGTGNTSPLSFSLDSGTNYDVSEPEPSGQSYGSVLDAATATRSGSFCWYRLGALTLTSGVHSINFIITGPAPASGRYTLGIDAICLSRGSFLPNGPVRPTVH